MTASIAEISAKNLQKIQQANSSRSYRVSSCRVNNYRAASSQKTDGELPDEIAELNTGNAYWRKAKANRYKKLIRDGYGDQLLELAKYAKEAYTKNPSHFFAKMASKKCWEGTLEWIQKRLRKVLKQAQEVARQLGTEVNKQILKACWKVGGHAVRYAVNAREKGEDKFKFFCWLVWSPNTT